jgi:hypothetical protein
MAMRPFVEVEVEDGLVLVGGERVFQARITWVAIGAMVAWVCRRGCSSQRHATEVVEEGSSERPWMVTRMPAMVMVWEETAVVEALSMGFLEASMVREWRIDC